MEATVLTIAGSDPTGGAGIQADLKTLTAIGVYAAAAVTCITVQNSREVKRVVPLAADLVDGQIKAVLEDHHVTHIKIGMVGTAELAGIINTSLTGFTGEIILDPVLLSTTGQELLRSQDIDAIRSKLISTATVVTPNLPELSIIMDTEANDPEQALQAADGLLNEFNNIRSVVVKGGHVVHNKEVSDILLYRAKGSVRLVSSTRPYINTMNTHGTGCTFASAYAAYHSLTGNDEYAFYNSANFVQEALTRSSGRTIVKNPEGHGGLLYNSFKLE